MKRLAWTLVFLALAASPAGAMNVVQTDSTALNTSGYVQWLGVAEQVPDPARKLDRLYLFLKEARLRFDGHLGDTQFELMWAAGGEDVSTSNNALGLLDFSFAVPLGQNCSVRIGQFLVPYGRERLTSDASLSFGDRSIQNLGFAWNRDVGAAIEHHSGKFASTLALMTGGGRDVPQRYLPEAIGTPMFVARAGYNDGIDADIYHVSARDFGTDRRRCALYVNGLYLKDSPIGHSTVLNVRSSDKNLLINSNWNPFIAIKPFDQATVWQAGADAVLRQPLGSGSFHAEAEYNYSDFKNTRGHMNLKGGRVQAGVTHGKTEINVRYAVLDLDPSMASPSGLSLLPNKKPLQEITPSLTFRHRSNVVVVADVPILLDALIFQENTVGSYVATEQPDQASIVKNGATAGTGKVIRKTVPEARLMIQLGF